MISKIHLNVTLRRLLKNKSTSLINILGLAVGITTTFLLLVYVQFESSYDKFHNNSDNIYQVFVNWGGGEQSWVTPPVGQKMLENFPEVERMARYTPWDSEFLVTHGSNSLKVKHAQGADNSLFELLNFDFIQGNPRHALDRPKTVVLNETTANKIYGTADPIGKQLIIHALDTMEVTGVVKDYPANSTLQFNLLYSIKDMFDESWMNHTLFTFVVLNPRTSIETLRAKMPEFTRECLDPYFKELDGRSYDDFVNSSGYYLFDFKKLKDVYLQSEISGSQTIKARLNMLLMIGILIFIIACINYTNLSTIHLFTRGKEVGIIKVSGGSKLNLLFTSFTETAMIVLCSLVVSGTLLILVLPYFNQITERSITLDFVQNPVLLFGLPLTFLFATLVAGTYPAIKLAGISPISAFKGVLQFNGSTSLGFRNILIIGQFAVCIGMIIVTVLFTKQVDFITSYQLGFSPEQILVVKDAYLAKPDPLKQAILQIDGVDKATFTNTIPGRHFNDQGIHVKGTPPQNSFAHVLQSDYDLKDIYSLELTEGRWFNEDIKKDKASCLVNEAALTYLNIEDPLNTLIDKGSWSYDSVEEVRIIGVVKDFNFQSLQSPIQPMVIYPGSHQQYERQFLSVRIVQSGYPEVVASIKEIWDQQTGNVPFEYFFLDQDFNRNYKAEMQLRRIFSWFSLLAIFVTCLGLLGVSTFLIQRRTKEIGIRKVNGASVFQIIGLLNKDFVRWVLIALLIASPIAYYFAASWLEMFAYRTSLSWWVFALGGAMAMTIAVVTVSWQSWKSAVKNPVDALRYE